MKCPKCGNSLEMMVDVTIIIPSEMESQLSKTNLRRKEVKIYAANWSGASYFCTNKYCKWNKINPLKEKS